MAKIITYGSPESFVTWAELTAEDATRLAQFDSIALLDLGGTNFRTPPLDTLRNGPTLEGVVDLFQRAGIPFETYKVPRTNFVI